MEHKGSHPGRNLSVHLILVVVQLCFLELYSWSFRKVVPFDQELTWARHNVNGVRWGGPSREKDDATLVSLPDDFLVELVERVVSRVKGAGVAVVPFNEGPEKSIHEKIAAIVKRVDPSMQVVTNRNDDTPGMYQNMRVGRSDIDRIAFHGWKDMGFLDADYSPDDEELARNPSGAVQRPWTFAEFFQNRHHNGGHGGYDFSRIICSSDGSRSSSDPVNTYDWPALLEVFRFVAGKGGSIEHQSRAKMTGGARLDLVEMDFLEQMARL